jgi:DNA-binding Lrp family transcriptional regulator
MEAYILVKISRQREMYGFGRSVVDRLHSIEGVENAELLFGDFDAILKVKSDKIHNVENLVMEKIATTEGVESTTTLLCVDEEILQ